MRTPRILILVGACSFWLPVFAGESSFSSCLPKDIQLADRVHSKATGQGAAQSKSVNEVLQDIKAHCVNNKLLDETGKEIVFYKRAGCWGNPPADAQEILDDQQKQIAKLKEKFTVVEINCGDDHSRYTQ